MCNYGIGMSSSINDKSDSASFSKGIQFYKQFPIFVCFFALLLITSILLYVFKWASVTALIWLALLSISIFVLAINEQWAMYLLVVATPIFNIQFIYERSTIETVRVFPITFVVLFVTCVFFVGKLLKNTSQRVGIFPSFHIAVLMICVWGIISEFWAFNRIVGIYWGISFITNIILYFLFSYFSDSVESIKKIMLCWIVMAIFVAVSMFVGTITGNTLDEYVFVGNHFKIYSYYELSEMRAKGIAGAFASTFVLIAILFAAGLATDTQKQRNKVIFFLAIAFLVFAFLLTQTKAPLAGLIVGFVFITPFLVDVRKNLLRYLCYIGCSFFIIFGIFLMYAATLLQKTIAKGSTASRIISPSASTEAINYRFEYWHKVFKEFIHHDAYIQGLGIGGCTHFLFPPVPHIHNFYLSILFDFGLMGFIPFAAIVFLLCGDIFYTIKKLPANSTRTLFLCIYASIISCGVASMTDFHYNFTIVWVLLGLVAGVHKYIRNYVSTHNKTLA